jgi:hypothetical protein
MHADDDISAERMYGERFTAQLKMLLRKRGAPFAEMRMFLNDRTRL